MGKRATDAKGRSPRGERVAGVSVRRDVAVFDWGAQRPVGRGEMFPAFLAGVVLGFFATLTCYAKGYVLLYGDAVAHLAIARRIFDARYPGISQVGGVWLPLPHLLMVPFVQSMAWWQSGLGGAPMAVLSFAAGVAGVWRLSRRMMPARWALVAALFYALNANLLFLASTAMTEALFLALLVWTVIAVVEGVASLRVGAVRPARRWLITAGLLVMAQVYTRYDGWIVGAGVWCCFAWEISRSGRDVRKRLTGAFVLFTGLCLAGPLLWFWFNQHFMGDWLDFMRGPYSAAAIERKTAPPGQHYRGWHNPGWALLFFTRTAQVDASAWESGWAVMAAGVAGLWIAWRRRGAEAYGWLLWVPLPFYVYSVAYGSVPIFIPQLWPHSFYNARYGMEMLPALSVYGVLAAAQLDGWWRQRTDDWSRVVSRLAQPVAVVLCAANCVAMAYQVPLVLQEGIVNARTRVPFEHALAGTMQQMPMDAPVMMYTSAHVGAVQVAGRTLKSMVSEGDSDSWKKALADPAGNAAFVIAMAGDPVGGAVGAHPGGLTELAVICTRGQPCARVYRSDVYRGAPAR